MTIRKFMSILCEEFNIRKSVIICISLSLLLWVLTLAVDWWITHTDQHNPFVFSCSANTKVQHSMFCEPTKYDQFVRHPLNTWSNLPQLWVVVLLANKTSTISIYEQVFIFNLTSLFIQSFLWHSTNCNIVHQFDLTFMYSCIFSAFVRFVSLQFSLKKKKDLTNLFTIIQLLITVIFAIVHQNELLEGNQDEYFMIHPEVQQEEKILTGFQIIGFILIPSAQTLMYTGMFSLLPFLNMGWQSGINLILMVGWWVHMAEKWCLNMGCQAGSWFQPTAVFHLITGVIIAMFVATIAVFQTLIKIKIE